MEMMLEWLQSLEWTRLIPELLGKAAGFLVGAVASWYLLFRKKLDDIQRLQKGDSDDFIFQMHKLWPVEGTDKTALLFRNVAPKTTLHDLFDNEAAKDSLINLADETSLADPILQTEGTLGFELVNDAAGHIAGLLATTPFPRETWLFVLTCEDRKVVRKKCIRAFLIRPEDLQKFTDWEWCTEKVYVESKWHWFRVVALHRIAVAWQQQNENKKDHKAKAMPLVDKQVRHNRIRRLSVGINQEESPIRDPREIEWSEHLPTLQEMGLDVSSKQSNDQSDS